MLTLVVVILYIWFGIVFFWVVDPADWQVILFWPLCLVFGLVYLVLKGAYATYKFIASWNWNMKS